MADGAIYSDSNATLKPLNTIFNGRCYVWTAKIKGRKSEPKLVIHVKVPENKWVLFDLLYLVYIVYMHIHQTLLIKFQFFPEETYFVSRFT